MQCHTSGCYVDLPLPLPHPSPQDTLEEANALLSELEARDSKQQQSSSGAPEKLDVVGDVDSGSSHPSITQIEG